MLSTPQHDSNTSEAHTNNTFLNTLLNTLLNTFLKLDHWVGALIDPDSYEKLGATPPMIQLITMGDVSNP